MRPLRNSGTQAKRNYGALHRTGSGLQLQDRLMSALYHVFHVRLLLLILPKGADGFSYRRGCLGSAAMTAEPVRQHGTASVSSVRNQLYSILIAVPATNV